MQGALNNTVDELSRQDDVLEALIIAMRMEIDKLRAELAIVRAHGAGGFVAHHNPRLDIPKPKEFKGSQVAKDVDNFLWSMENYFRATGINDDAMRVNTVSVYLSDVALLWWCRRSDERSGDPITIWGHVEVELR